MSDDEPLVLRGFVELELTRRGTTNGNARGSAADRRARRAWLMRVWASDLPGLCRCYRCGGLLFNPDERDVPGAERVETSMYDAERIVVTYRPGPDHGPFGYEVAAGPLTIDRIIPGCEGGTYRRSNIRPACGDCNSETGGKLARRPKRRQKGRRS